MRMPHRCGASAPCVLRWPTLTRWLSSALSRVRIPDLLQNGKRTPGWTSFPSQTGGELGIRTPDALLGHTRLAGEHLRPLGQLSVTAVISYPTRTRLHKKRNTSLQNSLADIPVAGPAPIAKTCSARSTRHCRAHATSGTRNARPRRKSRFRPAGPQHRQ